MLTAKTSLYSAECLDEALELEAKWFEKEIKPKENKSLTSTKAYPDLTKALAEYELKVKALEENAKKFDEEMEFLRAGKRKIELNLEL